MTAASVTQAEMRFTQNPEPYNPKRFLLTMGFSCVTIGYMEPDELKRQREKLGFTQAELASALGVHRVAVARWETGTRKIPSMLRLALKALVQERRKRLKQRAAKAARKENNK